MSNHKDSKDFPKGYRPKDIEQRVVKEFLDVIILIEMKKQSNISGYDITGFVNKKFGGMLSPGTIYATLYSLERKGIIAGESGRRKTVYHLTDQGQEVIDSLMVDFNREMAVFVRKFLSISEKT